MGCIVNGGNEVVVGGLLKEEICLLGMSEVIEKWMGKVGFIKGGR